MTCGQGTDDTKLRAIIEIVGIDSVSMALGLNLERVRAMRDGTADIDPESAALIHREVARLKQAGVWVEEAETPESEIIEPDDATAVVAEITVPEAGPQDVAGPREAVRDIAEGVLARSVVMQGEFLFETDKLMSEYDQALFDILRYRLDLELNFRRPLSTGTDVPRESAASRDDLIRSTKSKLRHAETQLEKSRGRFSWLKKNSDPSGSGLYRRLVIDYCEKVRVDPEVALTLGLEGIGRFLYPEIYGTRDILAPKLDGRKRLAAEALLQAILLAEEVEFRSPLPCEAELAASEIKWRMGLMLLMELGIAPPTPSRCLGGLDSHSVPESERVMVNLVKSLLKNLMYLDERKRDCRGYEGWQSALAFFQQLIDESGAEECRPLTWIMRQDLVAICDDFFRDKVPKGFFQLY